MSLHHPDTEFFSQGIVLIITLWWIIERKCWGRVRWGELIQSSDPHLQLRRGHQNKLRASCAGPGWARRWSLDLGPGDTEELVAATGARHQGWALYTCTLASHWSEETILASDWLSRRHQSQALIPDERRWDAARDNKISPSGRECNAQYSACTAL